VVFRYYTLMIKVTYGQWIVCKIIGWFLFICDTRRELRRAVEIGGQRHGVALLAVEVLPACVGLPRQRALMAASCTAIVVSELCLIPILVLIQFSVKAEYYTLDGTNRSLDVNSRHSYIPWIVVKLFCGHASMDFFSCNHFANWFESDSYLLDTPHFLQIHVYVYIKNIIFCTIYVNISWVQIYCSTHISF
jgi:hypothetical protein